MPHEDFEDIFSNAYIVSVYKIVVLIWT